MAEKLDLDALEKLAQFVAKHGWVTEKWAEEHFGSETEAKFVAMLDGDTVLALIARIRASEATGNHGVSEVEIDSIWALHFPPRYRSEFRGAARAIERLILSRAAPSATVDVAASGEVVQADLYANGVHEPKEGMHLDAEDVQFLATRLRRLFARFNYPLPKFADDGRRLIGIAPSCIGAVLANLDAAGVASVPEGYALVPLEPTDDMTVAFAEAWFSKARPIDDCEMSDAYAAMLAAAPTPTAPADVARDAERLKGIRRLCGFIQNGTDTVVKIFEDDATREWVMKVGTQTFYAPTFTSVLDAAITANKENP